MGRLISRIVGLCGLLAAGVYFPSPALAADEPPRDVSISLSADEMSYDSELGIITASGDVEIHGDDRMLVADTVTYSQKSDLLTASGNVSIVEPGGDVLFGEYMELTGDMKDGIIEDLRVVLSDRSRIAANGARRSNANILEMRKAVYSPCDLCADDPSRPPLWQIKAVKVVHDKSRQTVEYTDAWLEVAGFPVAYTPYLSHPDPTVKRRSGFITPSLGGSSDLGFVTRIPYYINIAPTTDATVTPIYTANEGPVMAGEFRHIFRAGELEARASITEDSDSDWRGHAAGKGRFDIDDTWRWGFDVNRSSDDTYMRRYNFTSDNTLSGSSDFLTTHVFTEGFRSRNYISADAYAFQGLRSDDDAGTTPYVLPMLDYNHVGEPDRMGGRTNLDANLLALTRTDGADTRRLSFNGGWLLPYVGPQGGVYSLSTSLKGNLYHVNELKRAGHSEAYSGFSGRIVPQAELNWRYPLVREEGAVYQLVEPMASLVVSPYGGNPDKIPNEDSKEFEFDDTNLFSSNRFTGLDRVEGGPRINYGLKWGVFGSKGGNTTVLLGQSYRVKADDSFPGGSGLENNFSDIVGKVRVSPGPHFNLLYRTRLNKDNLEARRNEILLNGGVPALRGTIKYAYFDRQEDSEFAGREEITMSLNSQLNRFWRSSVSGVRNLSGSGEMRSLGLNLIYEDECFSFSTSLTRTFYEDRDIEPTDAIFFRLVFKTLGEVKTGLTQLQ